MSNKIPTIEEVINRIDFIAREYDHYEFGLPISDDNSLEQMKEEVRNCIKLHVKKALKSALESIPCLGSSTDIPTYEEVEKEVLNSYPENLIV
jgi:hypothetical protein